MISAISRARLISSTTPMRFAFTGSVMLNRLAVPSGPRSRRCTSANAANAASARNRGTSGRVRRSAPGRASPDAVRAEDLDRRNAGVPDAIQPHGGQAGDSRTDASKERASFRFTSILRPCRRFGHRRPPSSQPSFTTIATTRATAGDDLDCVPALLQQAAPCRAKTRAPWCNLSGSH